MDVKDLARRANEAFNAHDRAALRALTAENCTFWSPGGETVKGRDACVEANGLWFDACSDAHVTITREVAQGDTVVEEGIFEGTHDGTLKTPMGDVPATGRRLRGEYVTISRFRDGQAVEQKLYFDRMQVAEQLGLLPAPTGATS
jgi:steroid delta-isomerase-like uncharacterized protein